jgi:hypothetical protein
VDHKNKPAQAGMQNTTNTQTTISRRSLLQTGIAAGSASLLPLIATSSCSSHAPAPPAVLDPGIAVTLAAFSNRIMPADANGPAAADCGVVAYINRSLAEWNQADLALITTGLQSLDAAASARFNQDFAQLEDSQQDELMLAMEAGTLENFATAQQVFNRLHRLTLEGMFSDPYYGGNANYAGWDLIGYPGAVLGSTAEMQQMGGRLPALHTSAYGAEHDGH